MSRFRNCHFSGEGSLSVWFCGDNSIKIVNLNDFSIMATEKILPDFGSILPIPLKCVTKDECELIVISFVSDGVYSICNFERGEEPEYYTMRDLLPKCNKHHPLTQPSQKSLLP